MNRSYEAKRKAEQIEAALPSRNKYAENSLAFKLPRIIDELEQMQRDLENKQKGLEDDMNGFEIDVQDQHADPETLNNELDDLLNTYENVSEENIKAYLKDVQE